MEKKSEPSSMKVRVAKSDDVSRHELQDRKNTSEGLGMKADCKVDSAEDLKPRILVDPFLPISRCECCGKHVSELKPFGKAGDPLEGDFEGRFFVKYFRAYVMSEEVTLIEKSFECRNCIVLPDREYFEIINKRKP